MKALRKYSPQAQHHFTRFDQVDQLVRASEAAPEMGFMARLMMLCSLPRTNPGTQLQYKRVNGPYTLIMTAVGQTGLPFGNLSRLLLAWVCTEAVRTQSRELFLGASLSGFMRRLGMAPVGGGSRGDRTRLRDQMRGSSTRISSWPTKIDRSRPVLIRRLPAGPGSGGTSASPASGWSGRAKSNSARSSSTRSSAILCRWI